MATHNTQESIPLRQYRWLQNALSDWQRDNIISETQRQQIANRYIERDSAFVPVLIGILAAVFIGGGIILMLAHNWQELSRPTRAVISYIPLLLSQVLLWWGFKKTAIAREGAAAFHALALGASIALIGQTFHSGGDLPQFLGLWLVLLLPIALLYPAQSGHIAALVLSFVYTLDVNYNNAVEVVISLIAPIALLPVAWKGQHYITRWFHVITIFTLIFKWVLEAELLNAQPVFALLVCLMYLFGTIFFNQQTYWRNPLRFFGALGIFLTAIVFCFFVGQRAFQFGELYFPYAFLVIGLFVATIAFAYQCKQLNWQQGVFACLPLVCLAAVQPFIIDYNVEDYLTIAYWLTMGYILFCGIVLSIKAQDEGRWDKMNIAILLIIAVVLARFFDDEQSFLLRGILFMIVGVVMLVFNGWYLMKKRKNT